jgi:hypothetical protein
VEQAAAQAANVNAKAVNLPGMQFTMTAPHLRFLC